MSLFLLPLLTLILCSSIDELVIDIIINFHKGYYAFGRGKVIDDHYLIIKHYLKIYVIYDNTIKDAIYNL